MYSNPIIIKPNANRSQANLPFMIWGILTVVVIISTVAWLIYKNADDSVSLVQYDNENYLLMIPSTYTQAAEDKDDFTKIQRFLKPNTKTDIKQSQVVVSQTIIPDDFVFDRVISNIEDVYYTNEGVEMGLFNSLDSLQRSKVTFEKNDIGDLKTFTATGSLSNDNEPYGSFKQTIFVSKDRSFVVLVIAYKTDKVLWNKADDIISSFSTK